VNGPGSVTIVGTPIPGYAYGDYFGGVTLNGGTLVLAGPNALGTNTFVITGGALDSSVSSLVQTDNPPQNWSGNFTFNGSQSLNLGSGNVALTATPTITVNANTLAEPGTISGGGFGLVKAGAGTLLLSATSTYTGATAVNGGELLLATTAQAQNSSFTVNSAATLGVTNLSPGSAAISSLAAAAGSGLDFRNVSSTTTPLLACGNIAINGSCAVEITGTNGLVAGSNFPLAGYTGSSSGFANLQLQMPYGWRGSLANSGNQILLANVAVVATSPPRIGIVATNSQTQINWPADHTGWRLVMATNLANPQWVNVSGNGATATNLVMLPMPANNNTVFYRLVYP